VRARGDAYDAALLAALMQRYARQTRSLLAGLLPSYQAHLQQGKGSFRPVEIAGRVTSWRKDDTRLHVDSFPASPTQGRHILRVFTNIHPQDAPRVWKLGAPFEQVAQRFLPAVPRPRPGLAPLLQWLHVTKSRRTPYDHYMLHLHDAMKADADYQARGTPYPRLRAGPELDRLQRCRVACGPARPACAGANLAAARGRHGRARQVAAGHPGTPVGTALT
jgi:hypothetical protein